MTTGFAALPPWDAAPWFQPIKRSLVPLVSGTPTQLVVGDPMRVAIQFAFPGTITAFLDTVPSAPSGMGTAPGIPFFSGNQLWIRFLFEEVGPMVQGPWFAYTGSPSVNVTVWEILLRDWPRPRRNRYGQANAPQPGMGGVGSGVVGTDRIKPAADWIDRFRPG